MSSINKFETDLGVVLEPSAFSNTFACVPSMTATHEFVVPRSIPMTAPLTWDADRIDHSFGITDFNIFNDSKVTTLI